MKPEEFKRLLDKYLRGEATEEEERFVDQWYNNIHQPDESMAPNPLLEARLLSEIKKKTGTDSASRGLIFKVAASISVIVAAAFLFFILRNQSESPVADNAGNEILLVKSLTQHIANNTSEKKIIQLGDGSTIVLEPNSSIDYPETFAPGERVVNLSGEAFFKIKRDTLRPFLVYSKEVVTKVLGTSFRVKAREADKEITVSVKTGKVSVSTNATTGKRPVENKSVILTPNQRVVYNREAVTISKQIVEKPEIVIENPVPFNVSYDGVAVSEILESIEKNYGVDIQYDEQKMKNCVLHTSMTDEGLFERINIICKAINAEYTMVDAAIVIQTEGCN